MNTCKLIFRNVCKNIRDYLIYFLTLTLSVSLFYAFNSISDQPAFSNMGMTGTLLYRQLGIMLSTLSTMIAVVLAFLILYANQFLLKRRKKELGVYMMLGMKKGRISRLFAGETLCVGIIALGTGLLLGFFFSQGFSLIALRLFAINLEKFRIVFSAGALRQTVLCFTIIFFIVMLFNIRSVTNVKLIDLLTDGRKNESMQTENCILPVCLFLLSLLCIGISAALFNKNGILPSHENNLFQLAATALVAGTFLLFYSLSAVFMQAASARKCFYLKGLNTFLVRQIGSKIRTNYLVVTVVCGLLTITICAVSIGASTALAMNKMSRSATPYDLNVLSNVSVDGDSDIAAYLAAHDIRGFEKDQIPGRNFGGVLADSIVDAVLFGIAFQPTDAGLADFHAGYATVLPQKGADTLFALGCLGLVQPKRCFYRPQDSPGRQFRGGDHQVE